MRGMARCAALAALIASAGSARADSGLRYWELALPDVRYEFAGDFGDGSLALSIPIDVAPWVFGVGERLQRVAGGIPGTTDHVPRKMYVVVPELFIEPQLQLEDKHWRGAGGVRLFGIHGKLGVHLYAEGLGVVGQDGSGGGFGAGIGWGSVVSVGYRRIWTGEGNRNAILLDVRLFALPFDQPRRTLDELGWTDAAMP